MGVSRVGSGRIGAGVLALSLALLVSGCSLFGGGRTEGKTMVCPATFAAPDADKFAVFRPGGSTIADVQYGVKIQSVQSKCEYADRGILIKTHVEFVLVAPDQTVREGGFSYFGSIVDAQRNILTKDVYSMPFEFDPHLRQMTVQDDLIEHLPLKDVSTGGNYAIVIGLQLTQDQLEFNRRSVAPPTNGSPRTNASPAPATRP